MIVWIIEGWFGDQEWIEAVYATEESANRRVEELWKTRRSELYAPDHYLQGVCKFAAVAHEVLP